MLFPGGLIVNGDVEVDEAIAPLWWLVPWTLAALQLPSCGSLASDWGGMWFGMGRSAPPRAAISSAKRFTDAVIASKTG